MKFICDTCYFSSKRYYTCKKCNFKSCIKCWKSFFNITMVENNKKIYCMNTLCLNRIDENDIYLNFDKNYIKKFNILRTDLVYKYKKNKFKELLPIVEIWKNIYKLNKNIQNTKILIEIKRYNIIKIFDDNIIFIDDEYNINLFNIIKLLLTDYYKPIYDLNKLKYVIKKIKKNNNNNNIILKKNDVYKILDFCNSFNPENNDEKSYNIRLNLFKNIINFIDIEKADDIINKTYENNKIIFYDKFIDNYIQTSLQYYFEINKLNKINSKNIANFCFSKKCNGLIDIDNICTTCNMYNCYKCNELVESKLKHVCNENDINTTTLLKDSTRCPSCKEMITKSYGCDVMWCIYCHTHFNYVTGDFITNGNLHNPEYIDFLNKNNIVFNNNINNIEVLQYPDIPDIDNENIILINNVYIFYNSFLSDQIYQNNINITLDIINNICTQKLDQKIYVDHILNFIQENQIKNKIKRNHKLKMTWRKYKIIIELFIIELKNIYYKNLCEFLNYNNFKNELKNLCITTNIKLEEIELIYENKAPFIYFNLDNNKIKFAFLSSKSKIKKLV